MSQKLRVVVCGTSFGRFYIQGIQRLKECFQLVGILSTGSEQSRRIAEDLGVRLCTSVNEISLEEIDVACVVVRSNIVGGKGTELALSFLEKGIHVIQEQPVHLTDIMQCYRTAREHQCQYFVETFYPYLSVQKKFLDVAHHILERTKPVYLEVACSLQVLFPMMDMMGKLFGGFSPWKVETEGLRESGMFSQVDGVLKCVPFQLKIQNELNSTNPDNYFHLLHRMTLYTESGSLTLTESHGQIVWNPRYVIPRDGDGILDPYQSEKLLELKINESCGSQELLTIQHMFEQEWPDTIARFLRLAYEHIQTDCFDRQLQQQSLMAAKCWNDIGTLIGSSRPAPKQTIVPIPFSEICLQHGKEHRG